MKANTMKRKAKPQRQPADRFRPNGLYVTIQRACQKAGVPPFTPYGLRHLRAVELRTSAGLEVARAVLGHSALAMTADYSEAADRALAERVAL
jgi:integrase